IFLFLSNPLLVSRI
ncbi:hypothetical protein SNEBB_009514, partial [Seison nebaliae]